MKKWFALISILLLLGWHMAMPINLARIDLGRHIKNGELILQGVGDVLHKNFYSYTYPDFSFVNHHWFFGVCCYLVWHAFDFTGLALAYAFIGLFTFYLFFRRAEEVSSLGLACAFGLLSIPLLAMRIQIRPEGFSMLFGGLFWVLLSACEEKKLKADHVKIALVVLQIIWVNSHLFFYMGPLLIGLFWLQAKLNGQDEMKKTFQTMFWFTVAACLVNPFGLRGILWALVVEGFRYPISEEQSIFHLARVYPHNPLWNYFWCLLWLTAVPWVILVRREGWKKHVLMLIILVLFTVCAINAIRFIGPWAFFTMPVSAYAWSRWMRDWSPKTRNIVLALLLGAGVWAALTINFSVRMVPAFELKRGVNAAAEFFKKEKLQGPIFNNFDNGSYLIFHLAPAQKVFVDNRPEAFPNDFLQKVLIPMQVNDAVWQKVDQRYHFNAIFFDRNDQTSWARKFMARRLFDPVWAAVFVDNEAMIFLRRNAQNADVVARFQWYLHKLPGKGYKLDRKADVGGGGNVSISEGTAGF